MSFASPEKLQSILQCPACGASLVIKGEAMQCSKCAQKVSRFEGAIVFVSDDLPERFYSPEYSSSNGYTPGSVECIARHRDGIVLDLGAGESFQTFPNVVQIDLRKYKNTDVVVAQLQQLPFKTGSVDAVISQSVLEHVSDPFQHISEIRRILKPGGEVVLDSAFLQPLHGSPSHFFNTTSHALELLFSDFEIEQLESAPYQHPWFMLRWVLDSYLKGLDSDESRNQLRQMTIAELEDRFKSIELEREEVFRKAPVHPEKVTDWWQNVNQKYGQVLGPLLKLSPTATTELAAGFHIRAIKTDKPSVSRARKPKAPAAPEKSLFRDILGRLSGPKIRYDQVLRIAQTDCSEHVGEIFGPKKVVQSFAVSGEICAVDVMFATYMRNNTREVVFELRDDLSSEKPLASCKINASELKDNEFYSFTFDAVKSIKGDRYFAVVESPQSYFNNCVTVRTSSSKVLSDSVLQVNGKDREKDLTFRVYTKEKIEL